MNSAGGGGLLAAIALVLGLCGGLGFAAQENQGILEVRIKDHRDAIGDFAYLNLAIDKISLSPAPGLRIWRSNSWQDLTPSASSLDLTRYADKTTARVFRGSVGAGGFDAFHVWVKSIEGRLTKNHKIVPVKNTIGAIKVSFQVPSGGETLIILDLTVTDLSDHPPRGYELSVKGLEILTNGKIIHKIPPA